MISVVIPSYNSATTISYTLDALLVQVDAPPFEIIVVDSSDDTTTELLIKRYNKHGVKSIRSGIKVIPAKQKNIGVNQSNGELIIFLDADVIPEKYLIKKFYDAYCDGCQAGCGSLSIASFQRRNRVVIAQYYLQLNEYMSVGKKRVKKFPAGACVFCDKKLFYKVGGYPDIRAAEDVLFGIGINRLTKLWFLPDVSVEHIFRENLRGFYNNQILLGRYAALYRKKNMRFFYKIGFIVTFFYPVFFFIKLVRIIPRIISAGINHFYIFLLGLPYFIAGLHYWIIGFSAGIANNDNV